VVNVVPVGSSLIVSSDAAGRMLGWSLGTGAEPSPSGPFSLGDGATGLDLAVGGGGKLLLAAPAGSPPGAASLISTDPVRLATVACRNPANQISAAEWKSLVSDVGFTNPCAGR